MSPDLVSLVLTHMLSFRAEDLDLEGSFYIGIVLSAIIYGIYLGVYCLSIYALLKNVNMTRLHRSFYISFSSVLLLLNSLSLEQSPYIGLMMWIMSRSSYPGGPLAYFIYSDTAIAPLIGNIAQSLAVALNDSLLAYRCYIIFASRLYVVVLPVLCSLASLALGVATIPLLLNLDPNDSKANIDRMNAAAVALCTAANAMITAMITIKIISFSRMLKTSVHSIPAYTTTYTNVVVILVESATPCAIFGMLTCVGFFVNADTPSNFGLFNGIIDTIWSSSMTLFPQLIIYRVARGSAWTNSISQEFTKATGSLAFAPRTVNMTIPDSGFNDMPEEMHFQKDKGDSVQGISA